MTGEHDYPTRIRWTGNRGDGNRHYRGYDRTWEVAAPGKPVIHCSNDPLLGGDPALHNPEDLLIAALSACHMLWFLHLAHTAGLLVTGYEDDPVGTGETLPSGASRFTRALLRPRIVLAPGSDTGLADQLHARVHDVCFIARSVNFPISIAATYATTGLPSAEGAPGGA